MFFKRTRLSAGLMLAFGGSMLAGLPVQAQEATQRVEVTGSAIKRTTAEGPAPIEVITRKDIERTGATSVNELLRSISSIDIFDQGELASNSPAGSGTASIRLRGLDDSNVLVLLNGRRLPVNALYDSSGAGAAFDINSLPIGAIERIDIMKDGGSAIYGADAVAGVVNFITKSDYQGIQASASYGLSSRSDGKETRLGLAAGFGDLAKDGWNVLLGLDYFKRDPILRKDRDISSSVDFRRFGARDGRSSFAPQGNVVDPNTGGLVGVPYTTCPAENLSSGICRYDFNASLLSAYNGADRLSAMALGTLRISPDIKAFGELTFSTSKDTFLAHPVPDYFVVPITNPATQGAYEILDANGAGTGQIYIAGRFMQGGPRTTDRKSDLLNVAFGVEGFTRGLDWKASVSHGISKVTNNDSNYYDANKWITATTTGQINPTVTTNDPALVEGLKVRPVREGKSELTSVHLQVGGDLFKLPGGTTKYAVGLQFNQDKLSDTPDALTQRGEVVGSIQQAAVSASRNSRAAFGELQLPILKNLEGQLALRYDDYPNASKTSPKVALKYTPVPSIAIRGSYSESFRAPVLKQLYGAQEEGAITITTPSQCTALGVALNPDGTCLVNAYQVNGSNANLQPEKAKTWNLGLVFDANGMINASVDWWKISKTDDISSPTISSAIDQGLFAKVGPRYYIYTNLRNIAERETSGVDLDGRLRLKGTALGNVTLRDFFTYYDTVKSRSASTDPWDEYNGTYAQPRWRNTFVALAEFGPWAVSGAWRTVAGFADTDLPKPVAAGTRRVGNHEELDLGVQYTGFKGWEVGFTVKNALDRMPPLSLTNALDNTYTQMGFAELYTARGRFFQLTANYSFR